MTEQGTSSISRIRRILATDVTRFVKAAAILFAILFALVALFVFLRYEIINYTNSHGVYSPPSYEEQSLSRIHDLNDKIATYYSKRGRLPFGDDEIGMITTWRERCIDDGEFKQEKLELVRMTLNGAIVTNVFEMNTMLSRLDVSPNELLGVDIWLGPDQFQFTCLAPGGISENGIYTNGYSFAIGVFGNQERQTSYCGKFGTGYAVQMAYFPDVIVPSRDGCNGRGYYLHATWKNAKNRGSIKDEQIRFGLSPEPGVCMLIPPEAFAPGAVTNLLGRDDPSAVEYWVERLRNAPCGKWEIPELR